MKFATNLLLARAALVLLAFPMKVFAYTECPPMQITKAYKDVGGFFFIATGGYLNGYIDAADKGAFSIVFAAYLSGKPAIIRYARDGVQCGGATWDERISAVGM